MQITYYGHASFLVEIAGKKLLFDPFISPNGQANAIDINTIEADYILLSHAHEDHVADFEPIAQRTGAQLISTYEICTYYAQKGHENYWPMNHGGKHTFDFGQVKLVNAVHTSTFADGTPGGQPAGFVITHQGQSLYYAGDTALTYDMKLIADEFTVAAAILPIGDNFTMGIEDAVRAADFVGTSHIIGMHYNTFPFIQIDETEAMTHAEGKGKNLTLMNIGETISL